MKPSKQLEMSADKRLRRVTFAYQTASLVVALFSLFWAVVFAANRQWGLAIAELFPTITGVVGFVLARAGRLDAVLVIAELAFFIFITGFCLWFDTNMADAPRVTHLFFLTLAVMGYLNHMRRRSVFQMAITGASLIAFVVFASCNLQLPGAQPIPVSIRQIGVWLNASLSTALLWGMICALQREFVNPSAVARELPAAIRNGQLQLFYQPQTDLNGVIVGAEALLRWNHPKRGWVSPDIFIPAAETAGLMPTVGGWVLKAACETLAAWKAQPALCDLTLAINVSPSQFNRDGFAELVQETVSLYGIDPTKLKLELTENVLIGGIEAVAERMNILRTIGISFALDDFGTGYSSLSYLRRLPVYQLKIDRSFVQGAVESPQGAALVRNIIRMGRDLDFIVLAEGVETAAQHLFLRDGGCHQFQGYYFGRPVPIGTFQLQVVSAELVTTPHTLQARITAAF
ncbi:MAG: EAL domain-containing protein [Asticcacaulis sp.]|uniref:putative bifunctional diguanylate cyclase/phosphodiesterase n=1 Tax=Asticcacaulis sp. TaxID=1872648 RepID=UPI0039E7062C